MIAGTATSQNKALVNPNVYKTSEQYIKRLTDNLEALGNEKQELWQRLEGMEFKEYQNVSLVYMRRKYLEVFYTYNGERCREYVGIDHERGMYWRRIQRAVDQTRYIKNRILAITCLQEKIDLELCLLSKMKYVIE